MKTVKATIQAIHSPGSLKSLNLRTFKPAASCRNLIGHSERKPSEFVKKLLRTNQKLSGSVVAVGCIVL